MKMIVMFLRTMGLWCIVQSASATQVLEWKIEAPFERAYQQVYAALEEHRFFVVFEPDIQRNLAGFAERWGDDYNRNKLDGIRSMVFCNAWYANQVSNADPAMMALCPLHVTLIHKAGETRVLFISPVAVAKGSGAEAIARELEAAVVEAMTAAVAAAKADSSVLPPE